MIEARVEKTMRTLSAMENAGNDLGVLPVVERAVGATGVGMVLAVLLNRTWRPTRHLCAEEDAGLGRALGRVRAKKREVMVADIASLVVVVVVDSSERVGV